MIRRCSSLATSEPELLAPVFWTARCSGVEPLPFISVGFAPCSMNAATNVRATRPNGSMQGRHAAFVSRVGIGAGLDQEGDHFALGSPVPPGRSRAAVCRVVERFGAPAVASPDIRATTDEGLGQVSSVSGGRDVQSRVARVDVMVDRGKKVRSGVLATGSDPNGAGRERRRRVEPSSDLRLIP